MSFAITEGRSHVVIRISPLLAVTTKCTVTSEPFPTIRLNKPLSARGRCPARRRSCRGRSRGKGQWCLPSCTTPPPRQNLCVSCFLFCGRGSGTARKTKTETSGHEDFFFFAPYMYVLYCIDEDVPQHKPARSQAFQTRAHPNSKYQLALTKSADGLDRDV